MRLGCGHGLLIASITWSIPALVRCTSQESAGSAQRGARGNRRELSASSDGFCERLNGNLDELYAEQRRLAADIAAIESAALRGGCVPSSGTPMVQILPVHADSVHRIGSPTRRRANYTLLTVRTSGRPRMATCLLLEGAPASHVLAGRLSIGWLLDRPARHIRHDCLWRQSIAHSRLDVVHDSVHHSSHIRRPIPTFQRPRFLSISSPDFARYHRHPSLIRTMSLRRVTQPSSCHTPQSAWQ
jgi:hypothetical protein